MHSFQNPYLITYTLSSFLSFLLLSRVLTHRTYPYQKLIFLLWFVCVYSILNIFVWATFLPTASIFNKIPSFALYTDYVITNSLALCFLYFLAVNPTNKQPFYLLLGLIMNFMMILFGSLSELFDGLTRIIFFTLSSFSFIGIFMLYGGPIRKLARANQALYSIYLQGIVFLGIFWFVYPTLWVCSPFFLSLIKLETLFNLQHLTNIITKFGLHTFLLYKLKPNLGENVSKNV